MHYWWWPQVKRGPVCINANCLSRVRGTQTAQQPATSGGRLSWKKASFKIDLSTGMIIAGLKYRRMRSCIARIIWTVENSRTNLYLGSNSMHGTSAGCNRANTFFIAGVCGDLALHIRQRTVFTLWLDRKILIAKHIMIYKTYSRLVCIRRPQALRLRDTIATHKT